MTSLALVTQQQQLSHDSKDENVELINEAIKRLLEERKNRDASADDDDDRRLLARLLSQVESLKGNERLQKPEALTKSGEVTSSADGDQSKPKSKSGGDKQTEMTVAPMKLIEKR
ncbi:uncharacterized protein Pyn_08019 [Prunus yedoensis var. nudiflora]|uniref:Uncharacterized protein n=1 Tax=Prunus yedoensis var. nudiflora TaxID=2094558 RepID=A0A314UW22_PRUYE|nr:uncharacterized protein Pyn_08019 [Prunus yedoensis var. nudiflora]